MACNYYYATQKFSTLKQLKEYIGTQGYVLADNGSINDIFSYAPRESSKVKQDYGSPKVYYEARTIFADLVDQLMNPVDTIEEDEDGTLINVPYSRREAIELAYEAIKESKEEAVEGTLESKALEALSNPRIYRDMVRDFYPTISITIKKEEITTSYVKEENPNYDVDSETLEEVPADSIFEGDEDFEDPTVQEGQEELDKRENWTEDQDTINPLKKASEAVKDFMSNVTYVEGKTAKGEKKIKTVTPGYVFFALLQNLSGIDVSDVMGSEGYVDPVKEELKQIEQNFKANGMKESENNWQYQIFKKIRALLDKTDVSTDSNGFPLPDYLQLRWEGDNQRGHYVLYDTEKGESISLKAYKPFKEESSFNRS